MVVNIYFNYSSHSKNTFEGLLSADNVVGPKL